MPFSSYIALIEYKALHILNIVSCPAKGSPCLLRFAEMRLLPGREHPAQNFTGNTKWIQCSPNLSKMNLGSQPWIIINLPMISGISHNNHSSAFNPSQSYRTKTYWLCHSFDDIPMQFQPKNSRDRCVFTALERTLTCTPTKTTSDQSLDSWDFSVFNLPLVFWVCRFGNIKARISQFWFWSIDGNWREIVWNRRPCMDWEGNSESLKCCIDFNDFNA